MLTSKTENQNLWREKNPCKNAHSPRNAKHANVNHFWASTPNNGRKVKDNFGLPCVFNPVRRKSQSSARSRYYNVGLLECPPLLGRFRPASQCETDTWTCAVHDMVSNDYNTGLIPKKWIVLLVFLAMTSHFSGSIAVKPWPYHKNQRNKLQLCGVERKWYGQLCIDKPKTGVLNPKFLKLLLGGFI